MVHLEAMEVPYIKLVRYSHKTKRYSSTYKVSKQYVKIHTAQLCELITQMESVRECALAKIENCSGTLYNSYRRRMEQLHLENEKKNMCGSPYIIIVRMDQQLLKRK